MKIAVIFDNLGPYHVARLSAASRRCDILGIEVAQRSADYGWHPAGTITEFRRAVLFEQGTREGMDRDLLAARLHTVLAEFRPEVVAIPGWSFVEAVAALRWCLRNQVPAILMSESQESDEPRNRLKEWIKHRYLKLCRAALVGGKSHRAYLARLGMPAECVFLGYDAVDNEYFARGAEAARSDAQQVRRRLSLPERYFLASNRFVPKKNLPFLLRASRYRATCMATHRRALCLTGGRDEDRHAKLDEHDCLPGPCNLVLLGDGPQRAEIESLITSLGLEGNVHLPGFKQYDELPAYYGLAETFVHASTTEQWGLVVNEAMASGLPVLVSDRCGCAFELVGHGINGYQFDPSNEAALAQYMADATQDEGHRRAMGRAGLVRVREWGPGLARGLQAAAACALRGTPPRRRLIDRLSLRILMARGA